MYSGEQPSEERTRNSLKSSVRDRLVGVQRFKQEDNNNRAEATTGSMGGSSEAAAEEERQPED